MANVVDELPSTNAKYLAKRWLDICDKYDDKFPPPHVTGPAFASAVAQIFQHIALIEKMLEMQSGFVEKKSKKGYEHGRE